MTPTGSSGSVVLTTPATLSDPSDSLGLGTAPIVGNWVSGPAAPLSNIGLDEQFTTALVQLGSPDGPNPSDNLVIADNWLPGFEEATVQVHGGEVVDFLAPNATGDQVVDLFNVDVGDTPPLFNPDATGPIDIGGVELADPQDGALFNDLFDAVFKGDTADWSNATTLFDDWLGIDPSGAADAVDPSGLLPDLGF
ncbi:hypothetical protein KIH27_21450 [Mycobacterium sp. M1]|uniref:Uncharacterized protein n=1 Tax=Mycolicibacter acidiphilus TaxID=2835306 RepID=A0ABS5RRG7_9MYCO|nr:hypothetical protein [Mycolicibacter acidiphilus]MBS9536154.1 hypothetical protein [Mycolicibacter acidiphilus]